MSHVASLSLALGQIALSKLLLFRVGKEGMWREFLGDQIFRDDRSVKRFWKTLLSILSQARDQSVLHFLKYGW